FEKLGFEKDEKLYQSIIGQLRLNWKGERIELNFPKSEISPCDTPLELTRALGKEPVELWRGADYLAVYEDESDILSITPDFTLLGQLDSRGVIVTAPGRDSDFVSRFFAPQCGINEDPVTGSAHCDLMPYWVNRLNRNRLSAAQLSKRGGRLQCELAGDRVLIAGKAVQYLAGTIVI
ncbi:MAG: PhzF family phenazine biosynthesis protein, partial [Desulfuromonadaceae bacterium]